MKIVSAVISIGVLLAGCVTMSGTYAVSAYDATGKQLAPNIRLIAEGRNIYTVRNALCSKYPKAIVQIKDAKTNEELKSESPHQCR